MTEAFLYQKLVDRSVLRQGLSIPVDYQELFLALSGGLLVHGETMRVKILLDGELYDAEWKNQAFDKTKYPDHKDVMQIRYSEGSPLVKHLREVFSSTWSYVQAFLQSPDYRPGQQIKVPEELREYIVISATSQPDVFAFECITVGDHVAIEKEISLISEEIFESPAFVPMEDKTAGYTLSNSLHKVRKLDRNIGDSLKQLYDYRCQITGEKIGDQYSVNVVEAHHIKPFTESLNNDASNIIILSPSFHRVVHAAKPTFDYRTLSFNFPNGVSEKVKLNKHLIQI
ncbi:MAG: HNH endonuclease [Prevotellaceae bacterium]|nr:HNH endonuclease [Candidatus Faecinaster equi]